MMLILIAAVVVLAVVVCLVMLARKKEPKPAEFRDPIPAGYFRVVARDEMNDTEMVRVVGDFASFDEALQEAAQGRKEAERVDQENIAIRAAKARDVQRCSGAESSSTIKSSPTKFFIFDAGENFVGDWTGRKSVS